MFESRYGDMFGALGGSNSPHIVITALFLLLLCCVFMVFKCEEKEK